MLSRPDPGGPDPKKQQVRKGEKDQGRAVNDEHIEQEGKFKLPANFVKSEVVYNLHRQKDPDLLILVESFLSVFQLYQNDVENVVALMGSSMREQQEVLIVNILGINGEVVLLFDGDEDGQKCTRDCLEWVFCKRFIDLILTIHLLMFS